MASRLTLDVILELETDVRHIAGRTYLLAVSKFSFSLGKKAPGTLTFKSVAHVVLNVERHPRGVEWRRADAIQGPDNTRARTFRERLASMLRKILGCLKGGGESPPKPGRSLHP